MTHTPAEAVRTSGLRAGPRETWEVAHDHGFHAVARARELWRYRRLIWFFARQAFQGLYARTRLGWFWVVARPLAPLLVAGIVYGKIVGVPVGGLPYFLFLLTGSIAWHWFDGPWTWGTRGLEMNRQLITKLYFPRMILPLSTMSPGSAEPLVSTGVLLVSLIYYRVADGVWHAAFSWRLLLLPLVILAILSLAFSLSLFTSIWNARVRDARFVLGSGLSFWMFASPVIYPAALVPAEHRWLLWLNPMATFIETFKWTLVDNPLPPPWAIPFALGIIAVVFTTGFWFFSARESAMTDAI